MASKYWIKLYHEILDDPKVGRLSDQLFRRMIQCFLLAGETDKSGSLPSPEDMSWRFRVPLDTLMTDLNKLMNEGVLELDHGNWVVSNFSLRQMAMNNSDRARRWRAKYSGTAWAKRLYVGLPASPGIYRLTCTRTDKHYIGATSNIHTRIKQQLYNIAKDDHPMSADVMDYGVESIKVAVLELLDDEQQLASRESYWISTFAQDDLYNRETAKPHQSWSRTDTERVENARRTNRSQIVDSDTDSDTEAEAEEETPARPNAFVVYEQAIGPLTETIAGIIGNSVDECEAHRKTLRPVAPGSDLTGDDWVSNAIIEGVTSSAKGAPNIKYIQSILNRWRTEGYKSEWKGGRPGKKTNLDKSNEVLDAYMEAAVAQYGEDTDA